MEDKVVELFLSGGVCGYPCLDPFDGGVRGRDISCREEYCGISGRNAAGGSRKERCEGDSLS